MNNDLYQHLINQHVLFLFCEMLKMMNNDFPAPLSKMTCSHPLNETLIQLI